MTDHRWNPIFFLFPFSFNTCVGDSSRGLFGLGELPPHQLFAAAGNEGLSSVTLRIGSASKGLSCPEKVKGLPQLPGA